MEVSNLDNLGASYDLWSPGEMPLVLKSPGDRGVEWDLGWELYITLHYFGT